MKSSKITLIWSSVVVLVVASACGQQESSDIDDPADPNVSSALKLEQLTYPQIDQLDRDKSIFILTFGNLEEHGPHIAIGADTYQAVAVRDGLVKRLQESHPDYSVVLVPVIPLGEGGANVLAHEFTHIGTYAVRYDTLRAVAIDMGAAIAANGFKHIFLIHHHGAPLHNIAFSEAAEFVSDRFDANMVNISSLVFGSGGFSGDVVTKHLGPGWQEEIGITGHSGVAETSTNLYLHDFVDRIYKELKPFVVSDRPSLSKIHERDGWQGYWSDPSQATAALGKDLIDDFVERSHRIVSMALAGEDLSMLPVSPGVDVPVPERYLARKAEIDAWLNSRRSE
jgi:creatinine amidohydrolase/Fe(II)-dependent formamide hydrolase-like protein